eukprot:830286-Prorocentrum_minimum.AAC.1
MYPHDPVIRAVGARKHWKHHCVDSAHGHIRQAYRKKPTDFSAKLRGFDWSQHGEPAGPAAARRPAPPWR